MSIKIQKLSDVVHGRIKKIVAGKPAGFKLPSENELAKKFEVSRSTIREAISSLIAEKLVVVLQGKGVFVRGQQENSNFELPEMEGEILDAYKVANLLECGNVAFLAATISANQLSELEKNLQKFVDCTEKVVDKGERLQKLVEIDHDFHHLLATFSQNKTLFAILEPLLAKIKRSRKLFLGSAEKEQRTIWEHRGIVEALAKKEEKAVKSLMEAHFETDLEILEQNLAKIEKK